MDGSADKRLEGIHCLWFAAAVAAGVILALLLSPTIFRAMPSDLTRISVILDTLNDPSEEPKIVTFGTSVGMASVDMRTVSANLPGTPLGYNFSATGQVPLEGYLYYQELPDSVDLVVQLVDPNTVVNRNVLEEQKYNAFYMYGYRPDERTTRTMSEILGTRMEDIFAKSDFTQRFESRWATRQVVDRGVRRLLRQDLTLERSTYDLYYPSAYTVPLPPALRQRAIEQAFAGNGIQEPYETWYRKMEFLGEAHKRNAAEGRQTLFVLQPVHPAQLHYRGTAYFAEARRVFSAFAAEHGAIVIDGMQLLGEDKFVDAVHPTPEGGQIFSRWLAAEINSLTEAGRLEF